MNQVGDDFYYNRLILLQLPRTFLVSNSNAKQLRCSMNRHLSLSVFNCLRLCVLLSVRLLVLLIIIIFFLLRFFFSPIMFFIFVWFLNIKISLLILYSYILWNGNRSNNFFSSLPITKIHPQAIHLTFSLPKLLNDRYWMHAWGVYITETPCMLALILFWYDSGKGFYYINKGLEGMYWMYLSWNEYPIRSRIPQHMHFVYAFFFGILSIIQTFKYIHLKDRNQRLELGRTVALGARLSWENLKIKKYFMHRCPFIYNNACQIYFILYQIHLRE